MPIIPLQGNFLYVRHHVFRAPIFLLFKCHLLNVLHKLVLLVYPFMDDIRYFNCWKPYWQSLLFQHHLHYASEDWWIRNLNNTHVRKRGLLHPLPPEIIGNGLGFWIVIFKGYYGEGRGWSGYWTMIWAKRNSLHSDHRNSMSAIFLERPEGWSWNFLVLSKKGRGGKEIQI